MHFKIRKERAPYAPEGSRHGDSIEKANVLSRIFFCWFCPTFFKGTQRELLIEDLLTDLPESEQSAKLADRLEAAWFAEELAAKELGRKPSLNRALFKVFFLAFLPSGVLLFISACILRSTTPKFLANLLQYWDPDNQHVTRENALIYAAVLVVSSFLSAMLQQNALRMTQQYGMTMRVACCALIYRKVLRMDMAALDGSAAAKVVNLMSNDVSRFDYVFTFMHFIWITPLQIIIVCFIMYRDMGWLSLIGVLTLVLQTLPIQLYMSKLLARLRFVIAQKTDERVRIMNEIITGIEVIKMYAWETPFEKVVAASRKSEIREITKASYVRSVNTGYMLSAERGSLFFMILGYYIRGDPITASIVFSLVQYFNVLKLVMTMQMPNAISFIAETKITTRRLESFLILDEREDLASSARLKYSIIPNDLNRNTLNGNVKSQQESKLNGYSNGKITILEFDNEKNGVRMINQSSHPDYGVNLRNVTASWETIRPTPTLDNVSFRIPHGKLCAVIGSVGSGKSSLLHLLLGELKPSTGDVSVYGQVSYASQEPWLFVDTVRKNILFGKPYLEEKYNTVVKVCALEDDFRQFPHGDQSLVGERGVSLSGGQRARINLARAVYREADVYLLDDPLSAVDAIVGRQLFDSCIDGYLRGKTRLLVTHQLHYLKAADIIVVLNNGAVESVGSYDELVSSGSDFAESMVLLQEDNKVDLKETLADDQKHEQPTKDNTKKRDEKSEILEEEERVMGNQGFGLYLDYFRSGSGWKTLAFFVFILVITQVSVTVSDYWMTHWTNRENMFVSSVSNSSLMHITSGNSSIHHHDHDILQGFDRSFLFYVYVFLAGSTFMLIFVRTATFYKICMMASIGLHDQMFHSLLRGVMGFFHVNPSGRILNRFSKDIGAVDEFLPRTMVEAVQIYLQFAGILVLIAVSLPWTFISAAFLITLFYFILIIYLKSARAIKRLEGNAKSPVFSHLNATLRGISTIRCTKTQPMFIGDFDRLQDDHTSTWNQYIASSCTLAFWLDASVAMYLLVVTFTFLLAEDLDVAAGNVGLAISQTLLLNGMLAFGIKQSSEVISQMTSVERVIQYTKITTEEGLEENNQKAPDDWPLAGAIRMDKTSMRYSEGKPLVLRELNVNIQPGWKVGIVGRTGAGKTSLISALFRLAKVEGTISIDGIDTGSIPLKDLRASISIIPQEPVLFSATIRYNLDPFGKYEDVKLWEALEAVELKDSIPTLDFKVLQGGSNFSLGQRQLLCLARAILKNNKVLVLDEATANVDPQTDGFIQQTIRSKFSGCTVLTIAHRLNTIMDSDRVLVMSFGRAIEFDHPFKLLANQDGAFFAMVKETGSKMAAQLYSVAKEAFESKEDILSDNEVHRSIDIR